MGVIFVIDARLFSDRNGRRPLVQSDAESFQFRLEDCLVSKRLQYIQNNEYQVASPCHCHVLYQVPLRI